jgi:uncharacterized protein (TIGR00251 family)
MASEQSRRTTEASGDLPMTDRGGAIRFPVHVRPRASRTAISGVRAGALDVHLAAPPVDGEANAELVKLLAGALGVRRADVTIVGGASGRSKLIEVSGVSATEAKARLLEVRR